MRHLLTHPLKWVRDFIKEFVERGIELEIILEPTIYLPLLVFNYQNQTFDIGTTNTNGQGIALEVIEEYVTNYRVGKIDRKDAKLNLLAQTYFKYDPTSITEIITWMQKNC